jgi:hypothetical protein
MGDTFSERKLSPRDISVHVYGDAAWAEFYWDFAEKFGRDGSPSRRMLGRCRFIGGRQMGGTWFMSTTRVCLRPKNERVSECRESNRYITGSLEKQSGERCSLP